MSFNHSAALVLVFLLSLFRLAVLAEGTRVWEQSRFDDFVKGTAHGVAISSDGFLELAPDFKLLATTPSSAVWATALGPQGEIYAATGAPARVYQLHNGQPTPIFQPQELQVQALLAGQDGTLYAATNPDGKVYKLERNPNKHSKELSDSGSGEWNSAVYFDPRTKYIWALALDQAGNLYVATGDHGEIFRVTPQGEHSLFFKSDEPHIRVLSFAGNGDLIAGSDGSGLIYRITPKGEGFVLYSAPKREITSLVLDSSGNIYLAAVGEKRSTASSSSVSIVIPNENKNPTASTTPTAGPPPAESSVTLSSSTSGIPGGSEIYKISPDGSPARLWNSRDDLVYCLAFNQQGHLLAGTGNRGQIYEISAREDYAELIKAGANQITAFAKAPTGGLYASSSNLGKIFFLGDRPDAEGSYESDVFDARVFSRWGRAELRGTGKIELFARSGNVDNPDRNWSSWKQIDWQKDAHIPAPSARFIQWKAVLHPGSTEPRVNSVTLNYLPKNVAPEFDEVLVTPGTRYQSPPRPQGLEPGQRFDPQPTPIHDRQAIGVKWTVRDENDDQMVYSIYYRGDRQSRWLALKENLSERFYTFEASLLPDGGYVIKVVASDSPSHSPQDALSSQRESERFEVDTTPPQIQELKAALEHGSIHVEFRAIDTFSPIKRAEYSVDAGDWHFLEPLGQLSDAKTENYDFSLPEGTQSGVEHVVVVRAYDRYDNMASAKAVIAAR